MSGVVKESYTFGSFHLDVGEHTLTRTDGPTKGTIPEKAFRTLVHLVRNRGTLVTKDELLKTVWPDVVVEENNLVKAIYAIRRFLDDINGNLRYIETVPKHGYRFVAQVQGVDLPEPNVRRGQKRISSHSSAYELYLRGKVKAGKVKKDETEAAITLFQKAVTLEPSFAEAYAQLARAYIRMAFNFSAEVDQETFLENAEVAIEAALDLDPNLAEGHFARGLLLWTHAKGFPHEQAIRSYKRSLELDPNADEAHHQLSMVYAHIGLLDEAMRSVERALDINPNNTMARFRVSNYLAWQGKFDEANSALKTVPSDVSPILVERIRAEIYIQLGRIDKAEKIVDEYLIQNPNDEGGSLMSARALILAKRGDAKRAKDAIQLASKKGTGIGHYHHTTYNIASAYAALHEPAKAVKWLEATAADGFPCSTYFEIDPNLDDLRDNDQFIDLMSQLDRQSKRFKRLA